MNILLTCLSILEHRQIMINKLYLLIIVIFNQYNGYQRLSNIMKPSRNVNKSQHKIKSTLHKKKHISETKQNPIPPSSKRINPRNSTDLKVPNNKVRSRSTSPFAMTKREDSNLHNARMSARKDQNFIEKLFSQNHCSRNVLSDMNLEQFGLQNESNVIMQKLNGNTKKPAKNCKQIFSHTAVLKENNKKNRQNVQGLLFKNNRKKNTKNDADLKNKYEKLSQLSTDFVLKTFELTKKCKQMLNNTFEQKESIGVILSIVNKRLQTMAEFLGIQDQVKGLDQSDRVSFGSTGRSVEKQKKTEGSLLQTQSLFNHEMERNQNIKNHSLFISKNKKCYTENLKIPLEDYMESLQAAPFFGGKENQVSKEVLENISLLESKKLNLSQQRQLHKKVESMNAKNSILSSTNTLIFNPSNADYPKGLENANNIYGKSSIYNSYNNLSDGDESSEIFKIVSQRNAQIQDNTHRKEDQEIYIAIRNHIPANEHEIALKAGERVSVLKKDNFRWLGFKDGRVGYFPRNCLFD